jgi:hypothetical protein
MVISEKGMETFPVLSVVEMVGRIVQNAEPDL